MPRRLPWSMVMFVAMLGALFGATCSASHPNSTTGGNSAGNAGSAGDGGSAGGNTNPNAGGGGGLINPSGGGGTGGGTTGTQQCDVSCTVAGGTCLGGVCTLIDNPGNVPPNVKMQLEQGGNADPGFKWLYPYDKTVFPRGLTPPTLQFGGNPPESLFVHVSFSGMDYKGYFGASNPARATISAASWKAITIAAQAADQVKVQVSKITGGQVATAPPVTWRIAQGSLHGTIYYETYQSQLAGEVGIMKISPGAAQPTVLKTGCGNVCHTASADGSTLVAATQFPFGSAAYDLKNNAAPIKVNGDNAYVYAGVYPDGSFVISSTTYRTWVGGTSRIYDTKTGQQVANPSWDGAVQNAAMPAFAPDGKWLAFNREDQGQGHVLATMQYDNATKKFSNLQNLVSDGGHYLGWPAFTPDSKQVIYHAGSNNFFETDAGAAGDLYVVNVATHVQARLDALDGYQGGQTYLPAGDPNLNFAPTVLPEAVGGYFWAVFTSHRSYGNTLPSQDNGDQNGKLWVAAIDINAPDGIDASHPAFYLDGQEAGADNLRGFWVLDPCKADANDCTTGDECCGGYCVKDGNGKFTCSPMPMGCAQEFDKCTTAKDCCDMSSDCIGGHCATPAPK